MRSSRSLLIFVAALVAGAVAWFALRSERTPARVPERPTIEPAPLPQESPAPAPVVATSTLPSPQSVGVAEENCIAYPDGTRLPPLNGVTKAPAITFHRALPFTKVVRKELDPRTGLEWYVHENGARSTTRLMWRDGVQEAVGELEMPAPTKTVVDGK